MRTLATARLGGSESLSLSGTSSERGDQNVFEGTKMSSVLEGEIRQSEAVNSIHRARTLSLYPEI
jgi:hypothetical protein